MCCLVVTLFLDHATDMIHVIRQSFGHLSKDQFIEEGLSNWGQKLCAQLRKSLFLSQWLSLDLGLRVKVRVSLQEINVILC